MQKEIDYRARSAFLYATTEVMNPAPIDTLLELLPQFSPWRAVMLADAVGESPVVAAMLEINAEAMCTITGLGESREAIALKTAIGLWMRKHRFQDEWIANAALRTLEVHADGRGNPRCWYFMVDPDHTEALLTIPMLRKRDDETLRQFLARSDENYRKQRKAYARVFQFRMGLRKWHGQPANWTALVFAGSTFAEIARHEQLGEDAVRKSVEGFRKRTKLTFPGRLAATAALS